MDKKITIKEISRLCGVSVATVSRVINHSGRYSKNTEEKVLAAIEAYNYVPNAVAQGLRTSRVNSVGIIVPDITNEFFSKVTLSLQNALFKYGCSTIICNTDEKVDRQMKHLQSLRTQRVSGIVFISSEKVPKDILGDGMPKVFIDRKPANSDFYDIPTIEMDNFGGGYMAVMKMISGGCKKIAALFDGRDLSPKVSRLSGYHNAHMSAGIEPDEKLYFPVKNVGFEEGYCNTMKLLDSGKEFDGVFCYTDTLALGALRALVERGVKVPEEVQLVGYDDISAARFCTPPITTVRQPVEQIGTLAAEIMMQLIGEEEIQNKHHILPVELISRATTKGGSLL